MDDGQTERLITAEDISFGTLSFRACDIVKVSAFEDEVFVSTKTIGQKVVQTIRYWSEAEAVAECARIELELAANPASTTVV